MRARDASPTSASYLPSPFSCLRRLRVGLGCSSSPSQADADVQLRVGLDRHRRHRPEPVGRRPRHAASSATQQPYGNLKLAFGGATVAPPFDPDDRVAGAGAADRADAPVRDQLPERLPASTSTARRRTPRWPTRSPRWRWRRRCTTTSSIHTVVGESGQPLTVIKKNPTNLPTAGTSGRAYDATLFEASAITRLAGAAGKTLRHRRDRADPRRVGRRQHEYANDIYQFLTDYNRTCRRSPARRRRSRCWCRSRTRSPADAGSVSISALQVWKAGVDHPGEIVCTGPKYQYSYATDAAHVHLRAHEYERLGEKTAQVYFERVVLGHDWQPLQPTSAERERQRRHRALSRAGAAAGLGRRRCRAARHDDPGVGGRPRLRGARRRRRARPSPASRSSATTR